MRRVRSVSLSAAFIAGLFAVACDSGDEPPSAPYEAPPALDVTWPGLRGPRGLGASTAKNVPRSWTWTDSGATGVLWRSEIPLRGCSSPVVAGDRVFLTGATREERSVFCFHTETGDLLWRRSVAPAGSAIQEAEWDEYTYAAPTVATDGLNVYAVFGNGDTACFDYEGVARWSRAFALNTQYGHGSSVVAYDGLVILQLDQHPEYDLTAGTIHTSRVVALDARTGDTVWEQTPAERGTETSYGTPALIERVDGDLLVTVASPFVIALDPTDGREVWRMDIGLTGDCAPSPTYAAGRIIVSREHADTRAILPDGTPDWVFTGNSPTTASPVAMETPSGGLVFILAIDGLVTCLDAGDGTTVYWEENPFGATTACFASPLAADGAVYVIDEHGKSFALSATTVYEVLGSGKLSQDEAFCWATPALADGRIYVRGGRHLYCIAASAEGPRASIDIALRYSPSLRRRMPSIGKGTVHRNLQILSEQGRVPAIESSSGQRHYDHNAHEHYRVRCWQCGESMGAATPVSCSPARRTDGLARRCEGRNKMPHALLGEVTREAL
jgi:outer membrane protein assembly factor BamB